VCILMESASSWRKTRSCVKEGCLGEAHRCLSWCASSWRAYALQFVWTPHRGMLPLFSKVGAEVLAVVAVLIRGAARRLACVMHQYMHPELWHTSQCKAAQEQESSKRVLAQSLQARRLVQPVRPSAKGSTSSCTQQLLCCNAQWL